MQRDRFGSAFPRLFAATILQELSFALLIHFPGISASSAPLRGSSASSTRRRVALHFHPHLRRRERSRHCGLFLAIYKGSAAVSRIFGGSHNDKLPHRKVLVVAVSAFGVGMVMAFAQTTMLLAAAAFVKGTGYGTAFSLLSRQGWARHRRRRRSARSRYRSPTCRYWGRPRSRRAGSPATGQGLSARVSRCCRRWSPEGADRRSCRGG